jgi:hypothetical protein
MTTKAQRAAQARYDEKRPPPIRGRLSATQRKWLLEQYPELGLFPAMKRGLIERCGMPEI